MIDIIKLLNENKGVNDYRVKSALIDSYEAFYVHKQIETLRATSTKDFFVTVYVDHEKGKGESSFAIFPSTTEDEARRKIELAVSRAKMIANKPYDIVTSGKEEHEVASNMADYSPEELCNKIAKAVSKTNCLEHGSLNAVEIFVNKITVNVKNSRGVDKTQISYNAMVEAIPTWTEGGESVELYLSFRFTRFSEEFIINEINSKMVEVRDRRIAQKPATPFQLNVVIKEQEISSLLREITSQLNYSRVFSHSNVHAIGDKIQEEILGDALTVTMKKEIEGSPASAKFDDDGVTLQDKTVIENGVVKGYYGSSRFGQYLGEKEITGNLGCISLNVGSVKEEELKTARYIELVSLSGLQVDLFNDYIGGEVRLAYLHGENGVIPVTGISVSGSLKTALNGIKLSCKLSQKGSYEGPDFAILKGLIIV